MENFTPPTEIIALVGGGGGGGGGHGSQGALKNSRTGNPDNDDDDQPEEDSRGSCVYSSDLYESSGIPLPTNSCCEDDEDCQFAAGKDVNGTCNEANECVPLDSPIYDSPGINCEFEDPGCVYDPSDDFNSCNVTVIKCTAACNLDMPCNDGACCVERLSNSSRQCGSPHFS